MKLKFYILPSVLSLFFLVSCKNLNFDDLYMHQFNYKEISLTHDKKNEFIKLLKKADKLDDTTLFIIVVYKDVELLDLIVQYANDIVSKAQCEKMLKVSCDSIVTGKILELINCDPHSISAEDVLGSTPLMQHCSHYKCGSVKPLLQYYCDVNYRDRRGFSPAHHCVHTGDIGNLKELVTWHANVFVKSYSGKTLLHAAAMRRDDDVSFVEFLLVLGLNIDEKDAWGNTALFYAYSSGNERIMDFLLHAGANPKIKNNEGLLYNQLKLPDGVLNIIH